jgi:shikimate kinase
MTTDRVALVGFMAVGKSSVGPALAMRLGMAFVDLDAAIVARDGRPIARIFEEDGEDHFRDLERDVLEDHLEGPPTVLSTGGGVVEQSTNRRLLREGTTVVWLDARFETIRRRLQASHAREPRPLLERLGWEGLRALHTRRRPLYAACAHFRFATDRDAPVRVSRRIEGALREGIAVPS